MYFLTKKIHSNIHHICIKKNHTFIKAFFFQKKSFISAFFEKSCIHSFKHISYMHFQKQKVKNFINAFKKVQNFIDVFSQKKKKRKKYGESFVYGSLNSQACK